jgi:LAS superfamily LD-carboxypeptidase LdcB
MQHLTFRILSAGLVIAILVTLSGCAPAGSTMTAAAVAPNSSALSEADGYSPVGTVLALDSDKSAVRRLRPDLLRALTAAEVAAVARGMTITITDGWRSRRYQAYLFARAVQQYGSDEEASKWVKRPGESAHEAGAAVDIATADAMDFLNRFGSEWGICQVYANENWHFELLTSPGGECPALRTDGRG